MPVRTRLRCAGDSHVGMLRQNNEDRLHLDPDRGIFLVVDGMGGQAAGEKAAEIAINLVRARLERQTGTPEDRIREGITVANNEILRTAATNPDWRGMACVLTVAVVENGSATIGHVGDSRLYKIRRRELHKLTHDHSPIGEREDSGQISEDEAMRHPRRNEVFRDVGSQEHAPDDPDFVEVLRTQFEPDCALLLCSDGLSDQVSSREILRTVLTNAGDPAAAVRALIQAANRAGGKDNVSVVIVEGEQFAAAREAPREIREAIPVVTHSRLAAKPAIFAYGLLFAALIFAALTYLGLLKLPPSVPPPRALRVGVGGFTTIREALAAANPGDTVEVAAGEYSDHLLLKSGVNLKGLPPDMPVLRVTGIAAAIEANGIHDARISGIRIRADEKAPLAVGVAIVDSDIEIDDSEIIGAATGVEIRGKSHAVLRANTIQDCRDAGIRVTGDAAPRLLYNALLHNGQGVLVEDPARPVLQGNIFRDNAADLILPDAIDRETLSKYNFFLPPTKPLARHRAGASH